MSECLTFVDGDVLVEGVVGEEAVFDGGLAYVVEVGKPWERRCCQLGEVLGYAGVKSHCVAGPFESSDRIS